MNLITFDVTNFLLIIFYIFTDYLLYFLLIILYLKNYFEF